MKTSKGIPKSRTQNNLGRKSFQNTRSRHQRKISWLLLVVLIRADTKGIVTLTLCFNNAALAYLEICITIHQSSQHLRLHNKGNIAWPLCLLCWIDSTAGDKPDLKTWTEINHGDWRGLLLCFSRTEVNTVVLTTRRLKWEPYFVDWTENVGQRTFQTTF